VTVAQARRCPYDHAVLRLPVDLLLPGTTLATAERQARGLARHGDVRVRVRGDEMVARRWVQGISATGHSVLRARLVEVPDGLRVRGTVAPSGLDLALVVVWALATLGVVAVSVVADGGALVLLALVPAVFGVVYAAMLPSAVREGRDRIEQTVRAVL
jgi:hypothetical protein